MLTSPKELQLTIATRRSPLALWQANTVKNLLEQNNKTLGQINLLEIVTSGDKFQNKKLADIVVTSSPGSPEIFNTGKGLFIKEVQEELLKGTAHVAVHSMKDLPVHGTPGISTIALLTRENPSDVMVLSYEFIKAGGGVDAFKTVLSAGNQTLFPWLQKTLQKLNRPIGTSSLRRQIQLQALFGKEIMIEDLRGNVDSRLKKCENEQLAAIVLAYAGIQRLGLWDESKMFAFPLSNFVPSPAQGVVAIQTTCRDAQTIKRLQQICDKSAFIPAAIERMALLLCGGDCHSAQGFYFHDVSKTLDVFIGKKETGNIRLNLSLEAFYQDINKLLDQSQMHYDDFFDALISSKVFQYLKNKIEDVL